MDNAMIDPGKDGPESPRRMRGELLRVLLVEDDADLAEELMVTLRAKGFAVDHASDYARACAMGDGHVYDAALLDLGLPDGSGHQLLARWREQGCDMPVLIMTARGGWTDKVAGFEAGADDYIVKPFVARELEFRLMAQIRRARRAGRTRETCGRLGYDPVLGEFDLDGAYLDLTAFEWRILTALMLRKGTLVARSTLLESIYEDGTEPSPGSLEVTIGRLRHKIGRDLIRTVRGRGYSLGGDGH
ncbi:response regulator transcription factor (plasmid) [Novosphingobium sp. BL-8A]|uniref:response regulator n=1 Tax=Novosphingobium sp. BL-8A TaxID=3127639 RepID=UPI0037576B5C